MPEPKSIFTPSLSPRPWLYAVLAAYSLGLAVFPPRVHLVVDESRYVTQATMLADGRVRMAEPTIVVPGGSTLPSDYPPGTSLLQAPLVFVGGWPAAAWLSALSLVIATLATARLLRDAQLNSAFALLIPGFAGALLFSRIAMSDMPSCAMIALALWLLWKRSSSARQSFVAGLVCGLTLLFREPNVLIVAPFVAGNMARQRSAIAPLVLGGLVGVGARIGISALLLGDPWYVRDAGYGFSAASIAHNLPNYAVILTVFLPMGFLLPFLYRGARRPECVFAFAAYMTLFMLFDYDSTRQNGPARGLILSMRFILPLLPLLAIMAADAWPRLLARVSWAQRATPPLTMAAAATLVLLAFGIHPLVRRLETEPLAVMQAIQASTRPDVPVVTNHDATLKYFSPVYGRRALVLRDRITPDSVATLLRRFGKLDLAFLDRTDSELFAADAAANREFVARLRTQCRVESRVTRQLGNALSLQVLEVTVCS